MLLYNKEMETELEINIVIVPSSISTVLYFTQYNKY
jgi:hypothetical protein